MQLKYFLRYLSSAPLLAAIWLTIQGAMIIEFNRFFPDLLFHPLQ